MSSNPMNLPVPYSASADSHSNPRSSSNHEPKKRAAPRKRTPSKKRAEEQAAEEARRKEEERRAAEETRKRAEAAKEKRFKRIALVIAAIAALLVVGLFTLLVSLGGTPDRVLEAERVVEEKVEETVVVVPETRPKSITAPKHVWSEAIRVPGTHCFRFWIADPTIGDSALSVEYIDANGAGVWVHYAGGNPTASGWRFQSLAPAPIEVEYLVELEGSVLCKTSP